MTKEEVMFVVKLLQSFYYVRQGNKFIPLSCEPERLNSHSCWNQLRFGEDFYEITNFSEFGVSSLGRKASREQLQVLQTHLENKNTSV